MAGRNIRNRNKYQSSRSGTAASNARFSKVRAFGAWLLEHRGRLPLVLFVVLATMFSLRLVDLQIIQAPALSEQAMESRTGSTISLDARRGTIYDRNGNVLAITVDAYSVYANPTEVTDIPTEAAQLAKVLGGKADDYKASLQAEGTFSYVKRQIEIEVGNKIKELNLPGIYLEETLKRSYPYGHIGAQVVGFCNIDGIGISGLELYYDEVLRGTKGSLAQETGMFGIPIPGGQVKRIEPINGQDIVISIDIDFQDSVEQALKDAAKRMKIKSTNSIVVDAATGEVYAAASIPLFDPLNLSKVEDGATTLPCINLAVEPGSIFKTVSALSLLEHDAMKPTDRRFCPNVIESDGFEVHDAHDRKDIVMTLDEIIAQSSNIGISLSCDQMGFDKLDESIKKYRLNELTGIDFPGEALGWLPDFSEWSKVAGITISFGQGISVTPLQMVQLYGAIRNEGVAMQPHFLLEKPQTGEKPTVESHKLIDDQADMDDMTGMLRSVVTDGTAPDAEIGGYESVGKTSTAQIAAEGGGYKDGVYNLGFVGWLNKSNSDLVCYVGASDVPFQGSVSYEFQVIMKAAIDRFNIASTSKSK